MAHAHTPGRTRLLAHAIIACCVIMLAPGATLARPDATVSGVPVALARPEAAPPVHDRESKPLGSATERRPLGATPDTAVKSGESLVWWLRTALALAVVLTLIGALKIMYTRLARRGGTLAASLGAAGRAPSGVLEVLGRYPISRGHSLVLLRCDRRVLLLGQSAAGFRTLAEMSDTDDVASILTKTRDEEGTSMSQRFAQVIKDLERDPATIADERITGPTPIVRAAAPRDAAVTPAASSPRMTPEAPMDAASRLRARLGMGVKA
jgi:flagellar biogenesis protein FliO